MGNKGVFAGRMFSIVESARMGRDPKKNTIVYPAGTQGVSGAHCMLAFVNGTLWLEDLGSTYGTYFTGGRKLIPGEPMQLKDGDRFWLGSENESFVVRYNAIGFN